MASRRTTTTRGRDGLGARARPRALVAATGLVMTGLVVTGLVACGDQPRTDPQRIDPDSGTTASDPSATGLQPEASSSGGTGPQGLDTGSERPGYPAPDCATLLLPGRPSDLAATPRQNHDAEVLALSLDPTAAVAPQARYDTIAADLAAILALDPTLEAVHVGCVAHNGVAFWFFDHEEVNAAIWAGDYHAWDCHHAHYGQRQELRIDGLAVAIELDGVYGEAVWQAYAALPGLGDWQPYWFARDDWPVPTSTGPDCEAASGSIELTATLLPDGTLADREYRFEREDGEGVTYQVAADGTIQP